MANTKSDAKKLALELYMYTSLSQKEIAGKVGVTEKTLSSWATDEKWEDLKTARYSTHSQTLANLNELLRLTVESHLKKRKEGTFTKNDADELVEITKSIEALQEGISLRTYIQVFEEFLNSIPVKDAKFRNALAEYQTLFLTAKSRTR